MPELIKTRHSELPINIMFEEFQALEELQTIAQKQVQKRRKIRKLKMEEWISIQKKMRWQQDPSQGASCPGGRTPHGDPTTLIFFLYRYPLFPWKNHEEKSTKIPLLIQPVQDSLQIYFISFFTLQNPQVSLQSSFQSQGSVATALDPSPFNFYIVNTLQIYKFLHFSYKSKFVRMGCKTHVLHHPISDCHISILLKIQYILTYLITSL